MYYNNLWHPSYSFFTLMFLVEIRELIQTLRAIYIFSFTMLNCSYFDADLWCNVTKDHVCWSDWLMTAVCGEKFSYGSVGVNFVMQQITSTSFLVVFSAFVVLWWFCRWSGINQEWHKGLLPIDWDELWLMLLPVCVCLSALKCFDTVFWLTGRASGL